MIIRLVSEGQYLVSEELGRELDDLDCQAVQALEDGDELRVRELIETIGRRVGERGQRIRDFRLRSSDLIIPPADVTLDDMRDLFVGERLIADPLTIGRSY